MSLEKYLQSLEGDSHAESGEFTLSPERARDLLAEAALSDYWDAWLCVLQGFYALEASEINIRLDRSSASFQVDLPLRTELQKLARQPRFLLGWLNLTHFGEVQWNREKSELFVSFHGSIFHRYFMSKNLRRFLKSRIAYAQCPTHIDGSLINRGFFPKAKLYTVFPSCSQGLWSLNCSSVIHMPASRMREAWIKEATPSAKASVSALVCKADSSWSEVHWVSHGVIVSKERNTLERPGLLVFASVEELGLKTDLSGFSLVHDDAYLKFIGRLKREVLWML